MARFRAPSTSTSSVGSATPNKARVPNFAKMTLHAVPMPSSSPTGVTKGSKRKRPTSDKEKKFLIQEAFHLEKLRMNMKKRENSFIYVGNIPPDATESSLRHLFRNCGLIQDVTIRCISGVPTRVEYAHWEPNVNRYASVIFARPKSVQKALELNGTMMNGQPIAVVLSVGLLPEAKRVIKWRVNMIKERKGLSTRSKARELVPSPTLPTNANCRAQPSKPCESKEVAPRPLAGNFIFWNMTFPKSIL